MSTTPTSTFALPQPLAHKAVTAKIHLDDAHFARIAKRLRDESTTMERRLDSLRRQPGGRGQQSLDRDLEIHRLTARLRTLARYGLEICLGRFDPTDSPPVYVGRFGLTDADGAPLLLDWRAPAARPFFAATSARPEGVASRRRYRWNHGRIVDYWDEALSPDADARALSLDDDSAFLASLGASRSSRMRDVLGTIQADQDAIIRAPSAGALVVDGGPGTGKTVVALHRAAYLVATDPRLAPGRGGILFVGPHEPYLSYVADVLPSLGEDSVLTCTVRDFVPDAAARADETDTRVAALKGDPRMVAAIEPAVRLYEEPPTQALAIDTPWGELTLTSSDWEEAFGAAEPGTPHNEARSQVWEALLEILSDQTDPEDIPPHMLRRALIQHEALQRTFQRAWPAVAASVLVADLWSVPAYLRRCAPWLTDAEITLLQRDPADAWTTSDLPLLDAARHRLGEPAAHREAREREIRLAAQREEMSRVVERLIEGGDELLSWMDGEDLRNSLVDESAVASPVREALAGPFAHIVVDEAQELTDAEWLMLVRRCPSRSFTIVGDRAQARAGFKESWQERLERVGLPRIEIATLTVNYRTPEEIMSEAAPVIRAVLPDANVPRSIRSGGAPVRRVPQSELREVVDAWLEANADATVAMITATGYAGGHVLSAHAHGRVRVLSPVTAKGLEFDLVVLVDPESFGKSVSGAVDRYVAMTRATRELVIATAT